MSEVEWTRCADRLPGSRTMGLEFWLTVEYASGGREMVGPAEYVGTGWWRTEGGRELSAHEKAAYYRVTWWAPIEWPRMPDELAEPEVTP